MDCAHRIALYLSIQYRVLFVDFVSGYTYSSAVRGVYTSTYTRDACLGVCTAVLLLYLHGAFLSGSQRVKLDP